jgi:hypothetical protein
VCVWNSLDYYILQYEALQLWHHTGLALLQSEQGPRRPLIEQQLRSSFCQGPKKATATSCVRSNFAASSPWTMKTFAKASDVGTDRDADDDDVP